MTDIQQANSVNLTPAANLRDQLLASVKQETAKAKTAKANTPKTAKRPASKDKLPVPAVKAQRGPTSPAPKTIDAKTKEALDDIPAMLDAKKNADVPRGFKDVKAVEAGKKAAAERSAAEAARKAAAKPAAEPVGAKSAKGASSTARKAKDAPGGSRRSMYDWEKAERDAKEGKVPAMPPFVSYQPHIKDIRDLAMKGDAAGIKTYSSKFKTEPCPPSRQNMFRFRDLCLIALKKKAAAA